MRKKVKGGCCMRKREGGRESERERTSERDKDGGGGGGVRKRERKEQQYNDKADSDNNGRVKSLIVYLGMFVNSCV